MVIIDKSKGLLYINTITEITDVLLNGKTD